MKFYHPNAVELVPWANLTPEDALAAVTHIAGAHQDYLEIVVYWRISDCLEATRKLFGGFVVGVLPTKSMWSGVTYRGDKARVEASIATLAQVRECPDRLWPVARPTS